MKLFTLIATLLFAFPVLAAPRRSPLVVRDDNGVIVGTYAGTREVTVSSQIIDVTIATDTDPVGLMVANTGPGPRFLTPWTEAQLSFASADCTGLAHIRAVSSGISDMLLSFASVLLEGNGELWTATGPSVALIRNSILATTGGPGSGTTCVPEPVPFPISAHPASMVLDTSTLDFPLVLEER